MGDQVVITGVGLVTPMGKSAGEVLSRIRSGATAIRPAVGAAGSACPVTALITEFDPQAFIPEPKTIRLMNRDAILAVAAARLAMSDAGLRIGEHCAAEDMGLFGATGLAGIALGEVSRLVEASADAQGGFDLHRFGEVALRQVRPVLSFKILSNMPLCFVSIFEGIQGVNAVYSPWEGQGAQAIVAGIEAIRSGDAQCVLAGGCDVKTHDLAMIALEQWGVLRSWHAEKAGCVPGEGAGFMVLEDEGRARGRGARIYARVRRFSLQTVDEDRTEACASMLGRVGCPKPAAVVSAEDGDTGWTHVEREAMRLAGVQGEQIIRPKLHMGNLFAAAAAVQVGLAAALAGEGCGSVLANCFGHGSEQAAFVLEGA